MRRTDLLEVELGPGARAVFTTRGAGAEPVSGENPYAGANLALHVGDDPVRVLAHRGELEALLGVGCTGTAPGARGRAGIAWMNQIHSAVVAPASLERPPTADALLLDTRADSDGPAAVGVLVADCVPVLLATSDGSVVAAVHAGRRGVLDGVVGATVAAMLDVGVRPDAIWAATGPAICAACYEVPAEMHRASAAVEPAGAAVTRWGTPGLDLTGAVVAQLRRAGVGHISAGRWCTREDERFFSYRRTPTTGRLAGVVVARTAAAQPIGSDLRERDA